MHGYGYHMGMGTGTQHFLKNLGYDMLGGKLLGTFGVS